MCRWYDIVELVSEPSGEMAYPYGYQLIKQEWSMYKVKFLIDKVHKVSYKKYDGYILPNCCAHCGMMAKIVVELHTNNGNYELYFSKLECIKWLPAELQRKMII